jgi:iron complex outermembrane receptor protein
MRFNKEGTALVPFDYGTIKDSQYFAGGVDAEIYNQGKGSGVSSPEVETDFVFAGAEYQVNDALAVFAQGMWGKTYSEQAQIRGDHILYSIWAPTIYRDNYYLPAEVAAIMDANNLKSFTLQKNGALIGVPELGLGCVNSKEFVTTSVSVGFDLDLPFRDWHVRVVYQTGDSERTNVFAGRWRVDRSFLAMDAVDDGNGKPICRVKKVNPSAADLMASPVIAGYISSRSTDNAVKPGDPGAIPLKSPIGLDNTVSDCVPYNVMGTGNISPEALAYTFGPTPKYSVGEVEQDFAELLLNGELYEGFGYGPIGFAAGLTWRDQSFQDRTFPVEVDELGPPLNDPNLGIKGFPRGYTGSANLHYISTLPQLSGDAGVWEWFTEVDVPVWEGMVGNQEQRLGVDAAFRQSDYDRSGKVESWKFGLDYQLLNDFRLRYTISTDVREPTFSELFDSQPTAGSARDPRDSDREKQFTLVRGGNPNLAPEEA